MTYAVKFAPAAQRQYTAFKAEDPDGIKMLHESLMDLAKNPRPTQANHIGLDRYRIHIADYRVIYAIKGSEIQFV